jgi:hypothetical protein
MGRCVAGIAALALLTLIAACGGGGGGDGSGQGSSSQATATATSRAVGNPTATVRAGGNPTATDPPGGGDPTATPGGIPTNQVCDSSGRICLAVGELILRAGDQTPFLVTVLDESKQPLAGVQVTLSDDGRVEPSVSEATTDAGGQVRGTLSAVFGGNAVLTAAAPSQGLSVFIRIAVQGSPQPTPTLTAGGPGTPTPTTLPAADVKTIFMETDPFSISAANGGKVTVRAFAFDENNTPLNGVNLLFDFSPKVGILQPINTQTHTISRVVDGETMMEQGGAEIQITIPPGTAPPGEVVVTASAAGVQGQVSFRVVPGAAEKPIETVLMQVSDATCGADRGGSVTLTATVFDADNNPVNGVNVLFVTPIGSVTPLTVTSAMVGNQSGVAQTTLNIPPGAPVLVDADGNITPYTIRARTAGIEGTVQVFVVPGLEACGGSQGGELGEPASVTLSAGPNRIRVRGSGVRELSTVTTTVFDQRANTLSCAEVRFSLDSKSTAPGATLLPTNLKGGFCSGDEETCAITCATDSDCPGDATCIPHPDSQFTVITDRAGNAQIQLRSGTGLGTVSVHAEVPTLLTPDELTMPCSQPRQSGERCITTTGAAVTVTAGLPGRVTLSINTPFIVTNNGTLLTTMSAIVTDADGNTVDDGTPVFFSIVPLSEDDDTSLRVGVNGASTTNDEPPCDVSQYVQQTGVPVQPQPGNAITCVRFPSDQQGTQVQFRAESVGASSVSTVTLPGFVSDLVASVNPTEVQVTESQGASAVVSAFVRDDNGSPVRNVKIIFETTPDVATFRPEIPRFLTTALTDGNGVATATMDVPAGTAEQDIPIMVYGGGLSRLAGSTLELSVSSTPPVIGAGQAQTIAFEGATPPTIGVLSSGLPEQSILTFSVRDSEDQPLAGVPISFFVNGIGGEQITPAEAVTDEDGTAKTTIRSGTRAAPVQVSAAVDRNGDGSFDIVTQSTAVNVVGAPPSYDRMSMAAEFLNVSGRVLFGIEDQITAFLNDRFGNAVPEGTAVNFITNGASIFDLAPTDSSGRASGTLLTEGGIPADGIVTILATTRGEEPFIDANGNGKHDADEIFTDIPEPFIDVNGNGRFDPDEPNERFVDTNANGIWDQAQGPGQWNSDALIWHAIPVTFSGSTTLSLEPGSFTIPDGGSQLFTLTVADAFGNPLIGGSTISISVDDPGKLVGFPSTITVPDTETFGQIVNGINRFTFLVVDDNPGTGDADKQIGVTVSVDSADLPAGGNGSSSISSVGVIERAPTPTETPIPTATSADTPTATATVTRTATPVDTSTPVPTTTVTGTATPMDTSTPAPTATVTATATPMDTSTPGPTATSTSAP